MRSNRRIVWPVFVLALAGCARQAKVPGPEEKIVLHRVTEGETLEGIADDYYGDPSRAESLKLFNDIGGEVLEAGSILQIPLSGEDIRALRLRKRARIPYNEGLKLVSRGDYLKAVQRFQRALVVDPRFADAAYNLGVTYQKMKAYDKALIHFQEAIDLRPGRVSYYHFAIGNCFFHLKRYEKAVEAFERALSLDPSIGKALYALAVTLEKMGDRDRAREAWQRYLRFDSESEWAREARERLENLKP